MFKRQTISNFSPRLCAVALLLLANCTPGLALPSLESRGSLLRPSLPETALERRSPDLSDRAVSIAEKRYNGRAVGSRHLGDGLYEVRILQDNGKLRTVTIRPE